MDISVIIPNYNGANLLKTNLPKVLNSLRNYTEGKTEIIVVDDGSTDESLKILEDFKNKFSSLSIYQNEKNLGFSSTVNKGVSFAKGEIILLLNSDVYPEANFLKPLLANFKDEKVFAVGCLDKSMEGDKIILRGRGLGEWKRGFLVHRRGEVDKKNTLWVSGGSSAFKKSVWDKLNGFNEIYDPFYWEDIDLSYRALKSGFKIIFEPKSIVVHEHEKGSINSSINKSKVKTIAYRNQFIFVWENATDISLKLMHILWFPYHFVKALGRKDFDFVKGFFMAIIVIPKIIKSKFIYQSTFVNKDSEIINDYLI